MRMSPETPVFHRRQDGGARHRSHILHKQLNMCLNRVLMNEVLVGIPRPPAAGRASFVTFMQHGFEKGAFRRILDICWFVARPLIGMVTWREREIPGRESD